MDNLLWITVIGTVIGLIQWLQPVWNQRRLVSILLIPIEAMTICAFIASGHPMLGLLFASISVYKIINYARVRASRIHIDFLKRSSWRAHIQLSAGQALLLGVAALSISVSFTVLLCSIVAAQLVMSFTLLSSTLRHLKTTKTLQTTSKYADAQLPSLSVLIPARNETTDLQTCLQALIASDYPKLEIIVLDDCSQTKRTPEIIRGFAHDGVRFIAGKVPDSSWLAKNYAYQQLADAANGDYLLFCGVDVRLSPAALRELITTMLEKNKTMISILPSNAFPKTWRSRLIQPMRYGWELCLPRRMFNRPPVLGTCWIIERSALLSSGSFKATSRSIVPESYFARFTARQDGYSFLRSNMLLSDKPPAEQQATTVRMRYPQLRRRLELVWVVTMLELLGLLLPLPVAAALFVLDVPIAATLALLALAIEYVVILLVTAVMYGRPLLHTALLAPLYDVILLNYSMYRYEFSDVQWKDRNICLPVMRQEDSGSGLKK